MGWDSYILPAKALIQLGDHFDFMKLRVAIAQIPVKKSVRANFEAINRAMGFSFRERANVLLTPEGSLSGYTHVFDKNKVAEALRRITDRAKGRLGLALGTCYVEGDGRCYDQMRFYSKGGRYMGSHSKILLCSTLADPPCGEIEHYTKGPLRTFTFEGITIGGLICNDMWANPSCTCMPDTHLSQQLSRKGAKVIFHAVNGGRDGSEFSQVVVRRYHESNLRMRAKAGHICIVTVDNCHPERIPCSSPGGIVGPDGNWVVKLPPRGERFLAHDIDVG
jgi:predicted amidohydrolase